MTKNIFIRLVKVLDVKEASGRLTWSSGKEAQRFALFWRGSKTTANNNQSPIIDEEGDPEQSGEADSPGKGKARLCPDERTELQNGKKEKGEKRNGAAITSVRLL